MLIDKVIAETEAYGWGTVETQGEDATSKEILEAVRGGDMLRILRASRPFEIAGLLAWVDHLGNKGQWGAILDQVRQRIEDVTESANRLVGDARAVWFEVGTSGFLWIPQWEVVLEFRHAPDGREAVQYNSATNAKAVDEAQQLLLLIAWLSLNPLNSIVAAQQGRPPRHNRRHTKVLKTGRKTVYRIVIDGVERVVLRGGQVTHRVHLRGWHPRRHEVEEHERHYASGKVVRVDAHERGDVNLGCVPWFGRRDKTRRRYSVQPGKELF